jgi:hypothetical protein
MPFYSFLIALAYFVGAIFEIIAYRTTDTSQNFRPLKGKINPVDEETKRPARLVPRRPSAYYVSAFSSAGYIMA